LHAGHGSLHDERAVQSFRAECRRQLRAREPCTLCAQSRDVLLPSDRNIRPVAGIKLQVFGLDRHIAWDLGAQGDESDVRADLVRQSLRRADASAAEVVPADLQDTELPVELVRGHGQ